jgi:solute carrier family 35 protein
MKNALMTVIGAFAFGDFLFHPWNAAGLAVSMAGAVWYATRSALKVRPRRRRQCLCACVRPKCLCTAPQARQKSIKDSLLQQLPIIGRDRLKPHRERNGYQPTHSRTNSNISRANSSQDLARVAA